MAADSRITILNNQGKTTDYKHWRKLLKARRINAAISYWGAIGKIEKQIPFAQWLKKKLEGSDYTDLSSLADYLAAEMNRAVGNKPLRDDELAGIHVAGIQPWKDGIRRPTLYHVHNGDLQPVLRPGQNGMIEIVANSSPRELFTKHHDFSDGSPDPSGQINLLKNGGSFYLRNGDYVPFHIIS